MAILTGIMTGIIATTGVLGCIFILSVMLGAYE